MAQSGCAGKRSRCSPRRRAGALVLSLACAAAGVAACGQSAQVHRPIALLPDSSAAGQSYDWTASCQFTPLATAGCAPAAPLIGPAELAGNQWNLGAGQPAGQAVTMSVSPAGSLHVASDLSTAPPCTAATCLTRQANTWVRGFPSVLYGLDQCHAETSATPSPEFELPARVDAIPGDLVGRTDYVARGAKVTYDVAYDLWLSPSDTQTPCQRDGTIEVMIWTDYVARALGPASGKVGTTTIPYSVDGKFNAGDQAWSVYASNIYGNGHTASWGGTVWLQLDQPVKQGAVSVDISSALADVGGLLTRNYGWRSFESSYWLDTIAFGMEYGPQDASLYGSGPADFSLDLRSYCLQVGTTVAATSCH